MRNYLTKAEVERLSSEGKLNKFELKAHKSVKDIFFANIFTLFNTINVLLAVLVLFTGSFRNLMFMLVIIVNTSIGIYQELKAKKILDKLSLLVEDKVKVFRDNEVEYISSNEIVLGEYMQLEVGNQIVCDACVIQGDIECDESLLTGESDMITKKAGDKLFSGSFVVSGSCIAKVINVGKDNYINKLAQQAKVYKVYPSKLRDSLNYILKMASFMIVPIGIGLFIRMYYFQNVDFNHTILKIVAALIGMIAEGLILLTSVSLAVSTINLARKKVLVQELFCIETLARVNTLCFDKTGTLTTGNMKVVDIYGEENYKRLLGDYVRAFNDMNNTAKAISEYLPTQYGFEVEEVKAFSSLKKYSAVKFKHEGTFVLGAFEYIFRDENIDDYKIISSAVKDAKRVLVLAKVENLKEGEIYGTPQLVSTIVLEDEIRESTKEIFDYFKSQDVNIKIISGDNHISVLEIAKRAGLDDSTTAVDASKLTDEELSEAVFKYEVFGRVSPAQKKLMVRALKEKGNIVAMSGDGVNDVLALKESDISIAMANGSAATKQISNIVLLDGNIAAFYSILMEGRRVINNIQKVASLFLVKTFYSAGLSIMSILIGLRYPFIPIQLTLISTLTVGIPSFIITFEKSKERVEDNFVKVVIKKSLTAAIRLVLAIVILYFMNFDVLNTTNMIFVMTLLNGILMLCEVLYPFNRYKSLLLIFIIIAAVCAILFLGSFFALTKVSVENYVIASALMIVIFFVCKIIDKYLIKRKTKEKYEN